MKHHRSNLPISKKNYGTNSLIYFGDDFLQILFIIFYGINMATAVRRAEKH